MKSTIDKVFNYLKIDIVFAFIIVITIIFFFIILVLSKVSSHWVALRKFYNFYLLFSIYLIFISIFLSLLIAGSLIPNTTIFSKQFQWRFVNVNTTYDVSLGEITCQSDKFSEFVKGDTLNCRILLNYSNQYTSNGSFYLTDLTIVQDVPDNSQPDIRIPLRLDPYFYNAPIQIYLIDQQHGFLNFELKSNKNETQDFIQEMILKDPVISAAEIQDKKNIIYTLVLFSISFSVLAVFSGVNSLRQIFENK